MSMEADNIDVVFTYNHPDGYGLNIGYDEGLALKIEYWEWNNEGKNKEIKSTIYLCDDLVDFLTKYIPKLKEIKK